MEDKDCISLARSVELLKRKTEKYKTCHVTSDAFDNLFLSCTRDRRRYDDEEDVSMVYAIERVLGLAQESLDRYHAFTKYVYDDSGFRVQYNTYQRHHYWVYQKFGLDSKGKATIDDPELVALWENILKDSQRSLTKTRTVVMGCMAQRKPGQGQPSRYSDLLER